MDALLADLRFCLRSLGRRPVFTGLVVVVLALGLGTNALIFGLVDGVVLRPLPVPEAERLVKPWQNFGWLTKEELVFLRQHSRGMRPAGYFEWPSFAVVDGGAPEIVRGSMVTVEYFEVLGVRPAHGRFFSPEAELPGSPGEALISHRLWRQRYGGDPGVLGRSLVVDGEPTTIVGVVPEGLGLPRAAAEMWLPFRFDAADVTDFESRYVQVLARLEDGVDERAAAAEAGRLAALMGERFGLGEGFADRAGGPRSLRDMLVGDVRPVMLALFLAAAAVLLVVTVNVANLLLARGASRRRELAVRAAIGADRLRLLRLLTLEGLVLSAFGGALGLAAAWLGLGRLAALLPPDLPRLHEVAPDGRLLAVGLGMAVASGLLFGALPAARLLRHEAVDALRAGTSQGLGRSRLHGALVVAEVALAFVLVVTAGLVASSFWRLLAVEPGFDAGRVVTLRPFYPRAAFDDLERLHNLHRRYEERLAALPGVQGVGGTHMVPVMQNGFNGHLRLEGRPLADAERPLVNWRVVTSGYFEALGIPLLRGRALHAGDVEGAGDVALVNRAFLEAHLPGEQALGRRLAISLEGDGWIEIVGVVGDVHQAGLGQPVRPEIYRPMDQVGRATGMALVVRVEGEPAAVLETLRQAASEVAPEIPISDLQPMPQVLRDSTLQQRLTAIVFASFALLALVLAAAGIYAIVAFEIGQRVREMGLRMALGAAPGDVLRLVLGETLSLAGAGLALGLALAALCGRLTSSLLFEVQPLDPATLAISLAALAGVATLAALRPAVRAARLDPLVALREE